MTEILTLPTEYYDYSALHDWRQGGPRYYFWKHERGFRPREESKINALTFGTCWHSGQDMLWPLACGQDYNPDGPQADILAHAAFSGFMDKWNELGLPLDEASLEEAKARVPDTALKMYQHYVRIRQPFFREVELLAVEEPFVVPILPEDPDVGFVGLIDKVVRHRRMNQIMPVDHKTSTRYDAKAGLRYDYINDLQVGPQGKGYIYALRLKHPEYTEPIERAYMDASLVHKTKKAETTRNDVHQLVLNECDEDDMAAWMADMQGMIRRIREERAKQAAGVYAWPRHCDSCSTFGICRYQELCTTVHPDEDLNHIELPAGFVNERWNPIALNMEEV